MQGRRWEEKENQLEEVFLAEISGVGEIFRRERILRQDSLEAISDRLKIRTVFLDAIERQAYEELPGEPYATGFVRDWAKLYGLDVSTLTQQFKTETQHLQPIEYNIPQVIPKQTNYFRWPIIAGSITFIVLVSLGWHWWGRGDSENLGLEATILNQHEETATTKQVITNNKNQELVDFKEAATQKVEPNPSSVTPPTVISQNSSQNHQTSAILFQASAPCWIEIKNQQTGSIIVSQLLKEGETYRPPQSTGLTAKIGNPSALKITIDETPITALSSSVQPIIIDLNAKELLDKQKSSNN